MNKRLPVHVAVAALIFLLSTLSVSASVQVTGLVRDLSRTDPVVKTSATLDVGVQFVTSSLSSLNRPVFNSGAGASTSETDFNKFFSESFSNFDAIESYTLELAGSGTVEFNGNFYPVDGRGLGNEGNANNKYFTFETAMVVSRQSGAVFTYSSSDDMFVFFDGDLVTNLGGIHAKTTQQINLDTVGPALGISLGEEFVVRIFYVHRSSAHEPYLQIKMSGIGSECGIVTSPHPVKGLYPFTTGTGRNVELNGASSIVSSPSSRIRLQSQGSFNSDSSAWFSSPLPIVGGFTADFTVQVSSTTKAEGFAFVFQSVSNQERGLGGFNLGYDGIQKSVAVEFDCYEDVSIGDLDDNHISIHTRYAQSNDAAETASLQTYQLFAGPNIDDGSVVSVRVQLDRSGSTPLLLVWVNGVRRISASLEAAGLADAFPQDHAYFGFTASSTDTRSATIDILSYTHMNVASSPTLSTLSGFSNSIAASNIQTEEGTFVLQHKDACGNDITTGSSNVIAQLLTGSTVHAGATLVVDQADGSYFVSYFKKEAGVYTLSITIDDQPVGSSPYTVTINPRETDVSQSSFVACDGADLTVAQVDVPKLLCITARDQFGNLQTVSGQAFTVQYSNLVPQTYIENSPAHSYRFSYTTTVASPSTKLFVRLGGDVSGSPITVNVSPGAASIQLSEATGLGLQQCEAGATCSFVVILRDNNGNQIIDFPSSTGVYVRLDAPSTDLFVSVVLDVSHWNDAANQFEFSYSPLESGTWSYLIAVGGLTLKQSDSSLNVYPSALNALASTAAFGSTVNLKASVEAALVIQAKDANNNNRVSPNLAANVFQISVTWTGGSTTVDCDGVANGDELSSECSYDQGGRYRYTFVPQKRGTHTFTVTESVSGDTVATVVKDCAPGPVSAVTSTVGTLANGGVITAGQTSSFTIRTKDVLGNTRLVATDPSSFVVSITDQTNAQVIGTVYNVTLDGDFVVEYTAKTAGTYNVRVTSQQVDFVDSPRVLTVNAGSVSASGSTIFGAGLQVVQEKAGIDDNKAVFYIQAKDKHGNILPDMVTPTLFTVLVDLPTSSDPTATITAQGAGLYKVEYIVEATGDTSLTVTVSLTSGGAIVGSPATVSIIDSGTDVSTATVSDMPTTVAAGEDSTFTIVVPGTGDIPGNLFSVSIQNVPPENIVTAKTGDRTWLVTFEPKVASTTPVAVTISDYLGVETLQSASPGYTVTVVAGGVSATATQILGIPSTITAGVPHTFTITPLDKHGNKVAPTLSQFNIGWVVGGSNVALVPFNQVINGDNVEVTFTVTAFEDTTYEIVTTTVAGGLVVGKPAVGDIFQVFPTAGPPDAAMSSLLTALGAFTAGERVTLDVELNDEFDNIVLSVDYSTLGVSIQDNPALVVQWEEGFTDGVYKVTFTPFVSSGNDPATFAIVVNGENVPGVTQVYVNPSDPVGENSKVIGLDDSDLFVGKAGEDISFILELRDAFNNLWAGFPVQDSLIQLQVTGPVSSTDFDVEKHGDDGLFNVTWSPIISSSASNMNYTLTLQVKSVLDVSGVVPIWVQPGDTVATQSIITGLDVATIPAGTTKTLTLQARDIHGNLKEGGADIITAEIFAGTSCSGVSVRVDGVSIGNGQYNMNVMRTVKGNYRLLVKVNGVNVASCSQSTTFLISPLTPQGFKSTLANVPSEVVAGSSTSFKIELRDTYENIVNAGAYNIKVGTLPTDPSSECNDISSYISVANDFTITTVDGEDGTYAVKVLGTASGTYDIVATVNDEFIASGTTGCKTLKVTPGSVFSFTTPSFSEGVASVEDIVSIQAEDRYGNLQTEDSYEFDVLFELKNSSRSQNGESDNVDYSFSAVVTKDPSNEGKRLITAVSAWSGVYSVKVKLNDDNPNAERNFTSFDTTVIVEPATCMAKDVNTPFRCPKADGRGQCVTAYSQCAGVDTDCSGQLCAEDGACMSTCTCPAGTTSCDGYCAYGECAPKSEESCPTGLQRCGTNGRCASSCPSTVQCPPGTFKCADGFSCVMEASACRELNPLDCVGSTVCPTGGCAASIDECPTPTTCPSTSPILCSDGTCVSSVVSCPSIFPCPSGQTKCADGTCADSHANCPTGVTCPAGYIRCAGGECAESLSDCGLNVQCGYDTVRCPDGSCSPNLLLCGTSVTCPATSPIKCPDGSCVSTAQFCSQVPSSCPSSHPVRCPSGQCITESEECATLPRCPTSTPVRCSDGSCKASVNECGAALPQCPPSLPVRCHDGSCRYQLEDCPSGLPCPSYRPILCASGGCAESPQACAEQSACPNSNDVRCPTGHCASTFALCPSSVSCPANTRRCDDGSCRTNCLAFTDAAIVTQCLSGEVQCPQSGQGVSCASSFDNCPTPLACPLNKPVRCIDQTCAELAADCPVPSVIDTTRYACPGGGWSNSLSGCGTHVTCPASSPMKCWDETCRVHPRDCPPQPKCTSLLPFLCWSGECYADPSDCPAAQECSKSSLGTQRVQCPGGKLRCASSHEECQPLEEYVKSCPNRMTQCADGRCVRDINTCGDKECPAHLPHRCADGLCTLSSAFCNKANGCPYHVPVKCPSNKCAASCSACDKPLSNSTMTACANGRCVDTANGGVCPASASSCTEGSQLCADLSCTSKGAPTECTSGTSSFNRCPPNAPFRCSNGLCAVSFTECVVIPRVSTEICSNNTEAIFCADGSCRFSGDQCPHTKTCIGTNVRCLDNTCADSADKCGASTFLNTCPVAFPKYCPSASICVRSNDVCPAAGLSCPAGYTKRASGLCSVTTVADSPVNGCPSTGDLSKKCPDGTCVKALSDCKLGNGCTKAAPILLASGLCSADEDATSTPITCDHKCADGRCPPSGDVGDCLAAYGGCTLDKPYRCPFTRECSKYAAYAGIAGGLNQTDFCTPRPVCDGLLPVRCADGSCVALNQHCRPILPCPRGYVLNYDGRTCVDENKEQVRRCPPGAPALCSDGSCRASPSQCPEHSFQSTCSARRDGLNFACNDGSCRRSPRDCMSVSMKALLGEGDLFFNFTRDPVESDACPGTWTMCPNGDCVADVASCAALPACPSDRPQSCWDGSCATSLSECSVAEYECGRSASTPSVELTACADGSCRLSCPISSRCPLSRPYKCDRSLFLGKDLCVASSVTCGAEVENLDPFLISVVKFNSLGMYLGSRPAPGAAVISLPHSFNKLNDRFDMVFAYDKETSEYALNITADLAQASIVQKLSMDKRDSLYGLRVEIGSPDSDVETIGGTTSFSSASFIPGGDTTSLQSISSLYAFSSDEYVEGSKVILDKPTTSLEVSASVRFGISVSANISDVNLDAYNVTITLLSGRTDSSERDKPTPCRGDNCFRDVEFISRSFQVYSPEEATVVFANHPVKRVPVLSAVLPSGTLSPLGAGEVHSISFSPVPISEVEDVANSVTSSRRVTFGSTLSAYESIVGPVFQCSTPSSLSTAFMQFPFSVEGRVDLGGLSTDEVLPEDAETSSALINPVDVCLAQVVGNKWKCLRPTFSDRTSLAPSWTFGKPRNVVNGTIDACTNNIGEPYTFAFVHIPVPATDTSSARTSDLDLTTVILAVVLTTLFLLIMAYVFWRLYRYRVKYKLNQKEHDELQRRAEEIDETGGGLGIADDSIQMVVNPLVIEMQDLEHQLARVQDTMVVQAKRDEIEIEELEEEQNRLYSEINRVREELNRQNERRGANFAAAIPQSSSASQSNLRPQKQNFGQVRQKKRNI